MDPYKKKKRPRVPALLADVLEEKKESENEGLWQALVKHDQDLQKELKQKEKELQKELDKQFEPERLERTLDDII